MVNPLSARIRRVFAASERRTADTVQEQLRALETRMLARLDALERTVTDSEFRDRRDLIAALDRAALHSSAQLFQERLNDAAVHWDPIDTLRHSLAEAPGGGLAPEFGVFEGRTLRVIAAARPGGGVYGFDSFEGLPETWRSGFTTGAFATGAVPEIDGAELVVGWFDQTLPGFLDAHQGQVDFLHVDCDLYSSTVTVLGALTERIRVGTVIQFDEYFNYPGWQRGEFLAFEEWTARSGITYDYLAVTGNNEQVSVRITGIAGR